ncbi:MAG TPA: DUF6748 domain-containing protein [Kofleriaceae bacterium]|nr:DUF6748 domain-containing protein [Kofleriaceae bacterium]
MFLAFAFSSLTAACAVDSTTDDLAGTTAEDGALDDGKADLSGVYTYYAVQPDLRKCAAPMCGGHFVSRVNLGTTKCNDGVYRASCYVADVDLSGLGLSESDLGKVTEMEGTFNQRLLLKGTIHSKWYGSVKVGVFKATEAWLGGTDSTPDGVFVKIHDNGVRCIAAPCATTTEKKLNSSRTANIAGVDYSYSGASEREIESLGDLMFTDGVIIAGDRYTVNENGRTAKGRTATQYWTRVVPAAAN